MNTACTLFLAATILAPSARPEPPAAEKPEPRPTLRTLRSIDAGKKESVEPVLLEIAREYKTYTRVSDQAHWAPEACRAPSPGGVLHSSSKDEGTHGRKLYYLFARDESDYSRIGWSTYDAEKKPFTAAVGQVIVKESFKPVRVDPGAAIPAPPAPRDDDPNKGLVRPRTLPEDHVRVPTDADGTMYRVGDPSGLFIMAKVANTETPGTDRGWIYGTVSADLKSVTAFGRIESCMDCHTRTEHDRLFGPAWLQEREARTRKNADKPAPNAASSPPPSKR